MDFHYTAEQESFRQELQPRQENVPLTLTPGCGHSMTTWRAELPSMLAWMTPRLARATHPVTPARSAKTATLADRTPPPASAAQ